MTNAQTTTVNYTPSSFDIPNPERGFYVYSSTSASNYSPLDITYLSNLRNQFTPSTANYQIRSTLVFRYFILDDFVNASITPGFLVQMQNDFDAARTAGVKLIIRFSYTNTPPSGSCGNWICPPYGDANKTRILEHISQVTPLLQNNKDVITTVQMGFIGVWGENYYTDHFGDASVSPFILSNTNWTDRNDVLGALLDAVPVERTVQVRYPQLKQRYIYGIAAPTNSSALTGAEAYDQSDKSRIGFHNDCFLASDADFGTYSDYGPPVSQSDTINLKPYKQDDSQYVPVGGETCFINNPDDNCASAGGRADTELNRFNYSYLNSQFNNSVNNDWTGVCMEDVKKRLGYRIALLSGTFPNSVENGEDIAITINLENQGYAAPFNPRGLELVLRNTSSGETFFAPLDIDPRTWFPGTHDITESVCIPPNLLAGNYTMLLNLPDPEPTLFNNPDYSIQLVNQNVWESSTGYNILNHSIQVTQATNAMDCFGDQMFTSTSVYDPNFCPSILNLTSTILTDIYRADDRIISDGNVLQSEDAIFHAGNQIELINGFEVENGSTFWAFIKDCF